MAERKKPKEKMPQIRKVGRPRVRKNPETKGTGTYKLTPAISKKLCGLVRIGVTIEQAAAICMLHESTVHNWINDGMAEKTPELLDFALRINQAINLFYADNLMGIKKSAKGPDGKRNFFAYAWLLERVPKGQPFAIQRQKLEINDVTVKDAAAKISTAEDNAIASKMLQLTEQETVIDVTPEAEREEVD
ncbi:hypothetical protein TA3x_004263 [Tundrisphaera sp. TA3]|uniref:hypothetical protein n=1 Tax=Tundrisphaera sp. TA3 TaxID=3435775 RepID=UPI003EC00AD2